MPYAAATPRDDIGTPSGKPTKWLVISDDGRMLGHVVQQGWFEARKAALVEFHCEPWQVELKEVKKKESR